MRLLLVNIDSGLGDKDCLYIVQYFLPQIISFVMVLFICSESLGRRLTALSAFFIRSLL